MPFRMIILNGGFIMEEQTKKTKKIGLDIHVSEWSPSAATSRFRLEIAYEPVELRLSKELDDGGYILRCHPRWKVVGDDEIIVDLWAWNGYHENLSRIRLMVNVTTLEVRVDDDELRSGGIAGHIRVWILNCKRL